MIYLGPYAYCTFKTRTKQIETRGCPNGHQTGYRDKFCSECASPIKVVTVTVEEQPPYYFLDEGPHDKNSRVYVLEEHRIDEDDDIYELDAKYVARSMKEATEKFADHIEKLRELFDTVEIRFGLVMRDVGVRYD